jgi:hypothetical protein
MEEENFAFETQSFLSVSDLSERFEDSSNLIFPTLEYQDYCGRGIRHVEFESEPINENKETETNSHYEPFQTESPLLNFNYPETKTEMEEDARSSSSFESNTVDHDILSSRSDPPLAQCLSELVVAAVQSKSPISQASWSELGLSGQTLVLAWLILERFKDAKEFLQAVEAGVDLRTFANQVLDRRVEKRTDLYKRTFYKSFIQHLVAKYTEYRHTKSFKIKPFTEVVAKKFFSSSNEREEQELCTIFQNTKHFSVPNLKRLFKASAEFKGEFDRYIKHNLPQETEKEVKEFSKRLISQLSTNQPDIVRAVLSIVEKRSLVPWTYFDVSVAQSIYAAMTEKSTR